MKNSRRPPPPKHLSAAAKALWRSLLSAYDISDEAGLALLTATLEARDRAESCRLRIAQDGELIADRWGQLKPHPLLPAERDSRALFLRGMKQLNFDVEPARDLPGKGVR